MRPDPRFTGKPLSFWADIKTISEAGGYTFKSGTGPTAIDMVKVHTPQQIVAAYNGIGLSWDHMFSLVGITYTATPYGQEILDYLQHRSTALATVQRLLMTPAQAKVEYDAMRATRPTWDCPFPLNKQKGPMRNPAYLTCLVNMVVEANLGGLNVNYNPRVLTSVTRGKKPLRTMSRRVDGAFPQTVNPTAIWEVKEYYYTTTFGSRIADGVYETLLDGMEIQEMSNAEGIKIHHYLIVDAYNTWWDMGKSYLCRMADMLHAGYVDEVLFGREVITRLPQIVQSWIPYHAAVVAANPEIDPA